MFLNLKKPAVLKLKRRRVLFVLSVCVLFSLFFSSALYAATDEEMMAEFTKLESQLKEKSVSPDEFLKSVVIKSEGDEKEFAGTIDDDVIMRRNELIKLGLDSGANANKFLEIVIRCQPSKQEGLIKMALAKGAKISEIYVKYLISLPSCELSMWMLDNLCDANFLLDLVVNKYIGSELSEQKKMVNFALERGADPNSLLQQQNGSQLSRVKPDILELLFNNEYKKIDPDLFCQYMNFMRSVGYMDGLFDDPAALWDKKHKNLNAKAASMPKIPRIVHYVWLISEKKEMDARDINNIIRTKELFSHSKETCLPGVEEWKHIVWTNDKGLFPDSVKELESNGIQVREISEIEDHLRFGKKVIELIGQKGWRGAVVDVLKYDLIYYFGGISANLNFVFTRDIEREIYTYDYLGHPTCGFDMENFFFGSKAKHPILGTLLSLIDRNLNNPPKYAAIDKSKPQDLGMATTTPLRLAYYKSANNGTVDVIYPYFASYEFADNGTVEYHKESSNQNGICVGGDIDIIKKYVDCDIEFFFSEYRDRYLMEHNICGTDDQAFGDRWRYYRESWVEEEEEE